MKRTTIRQIRLNTIKQWISKFEKAVESNHLILKYGKEEINDTLEDLNTNQLKIVAALIAAAYQNGSSETREFFSKVREEDKALKKAMGES